MGEVKWSWMVAVSMIACLQAGSSVIAGASGGEETCQTGEAALGLCIWPAVLFKGVQPQCPGNGRAQRVRAFVGLLPRLKWRRHVLS